MTNALQTGRIAERLPAVQLEMDMLAIRGSIDTDWPNQSLPPAAELVPFGSFKNKYRGRSCHVVGRGPTDFDYESLGEVRDPEFFINDAVCLEKYARAETFFFAHDAQLRPWLDGSIHSTAVLPSDGAVVESGPLNHAGPLVYYSHRGQPGMRDLLQMDRDEIARRQRLVVHSGTIHSLLHFAWFCGFHQAVLIGCDGINSTPASSPRDRNTGYDPRLDNRSKSYPGPHYNVIRRGQDLLAQILGIELIYQGTPASDPIAAR